MCPLIGVYIVRSIIGKEKQSKMDLKTTLFDQLTGYPSICFDIFLFS